MTKKNTLKIVLDIFEQKNSGQSFREIMKVMVELKNNGMMMKDAIKIIDSLNGFTPKTVDLIADYCKYRTIELGSKHPNYFWQICQNKAREPRVIHRTSNIPLNV
jgi:hypothetical protein